MTPHGARLACRLAGVGITPRALTALLARAEKIGVAATVQEVDEDPGLAFAPNDWATGVS